MENIKKAQVLKVKECIDYKEGGINKLVFVLEENMKMIAMALDKDQKIAPHTAPGDALLFCLEGSGVIGIADETFEIKENEQIVLPKEILHSVEAKEKLKVLVVMMKA